MEYIWNEKNWLERFNSQNPDYKPLRREVWENTKAIVEINGYTLPDGTVITLRNDKRKNSSFYEYEFKAGFEPLTTPLEITVTPDDCLDTAHKWVNDGFEVCVLNLASRRNPGGGVVGGSGAQEEYLFRCSDYHMFMYCFARYAEEYGLQRSKYQYPLDRNFGGVYSPEVVVFRENEASGYKLTVSPWKVNMIAVAAMNHPQLTYENGEERIVYRLVEAVKNKMRTIFRIATDHKQRNLVLGAFGCGAFHNPPKHIAELFKEVLNEEEFSGAFSKICFSIKSDHRSPNGENYLAFKKVFG